MRSLRLGLRTLVVVLFCVWLLGPLLIMLVLPIALRAPLPLPLPTDQFLLLWIGVPVLLSGAWGVVESRRY